MRAAVMPHLLQPGTGEHPTHRSTAGLRDQTDNQPDERMECRGGKARAELGKETGQRARCGGAGRHRGITLTRTVKERSMLSCSPPKIHEPLVTGVSPRPTARRQRQELRNTSEPEGANYWQPLLIGKPAEQLRHDEASGWCAILSPTVGLDAVVVGQFERAFSDRQFEQVAGRAAARRARLLPTTFAPRQTLRVRRTTYSVDRVTEYLEGAAENDSRSTGRPSLSGKTGTQDVERPSYHGDIRRRRSPEIWRASHFLRGQNNRGCSTCITNGGLKFRRCTDGYKVPRAVGKRPCLGRKSVRRRSGATHGSWLGAAGRDQCDSS